MDRDTAVAQIRKACHGVSIELMKPAVSALDNKEAQDEIYRTLYELTKEVETSKNGWQNSRARTTAATYKLSRLRDPWLWHQRKEEPTHGDQKTRMASPDAKEIGHAVAA